MVSASWNEDTGIYEICVVKDGVVSTDWAHILINGTGILNNWKWPTIPGLHDFAGKLLHSANWDDHVDLEGKTVAIIGTGSSAIQIVPQIQPKVKKLVAVMRSVTWILPPWAETVLQQTEADSRFPDSSPQAQYLYTKEEKERFNDNPDDLLAYRKELEAKFNGMFEIFIKDSEASHQAEEHMRAGMHRRLGPGHEELKERLVPKWPPGCRRLTPGIGYLEALVKPNVKTVHKEIVKITPKGLIDQEGELHPVDVIICATGFDVSFKPSFKLLGVDGTNIVDEFDPEPHVYLGMAVPKFPNYFTVNGVRGSWATGTALNSIEACLDYILTCAKRIQSENIRALEVEMGPIKDLYAHIDHWHKRSVWNADCKRQVERPCIDNVTLTFLSAAGIRTTYRAGNCGSGGVR